MRAAFLLLAAALLAPLPSAAQRAGALTAEQGAREEERDRLRADAAEIRREVERLRGELLALGAAQAAGERDVGGKRSRLDELNARESDLRARMARTRSEQARLLGALQLYRRNPPPALFVHPDKATDAVRAVILMRSIAPELQKRAAAFSEETARITTLRRQAAAASEALFTAESAVADRRGEIERLIAEKGALERSLLLDADAADAQARALAARARSLGELAGAVAARPASPVGGAAPIRVIAPAEGAIVRRFGDPTEAGQARGLSFETEPNAQVRSPADARVDFAGLLKGHGVVVILRGGGGYDFVLSGLQSAAAPLGGRVAAGEPIGRMAGSRNPAPELYLEVRRGGAPVDPAGLLARAAAESAASRPRGLRGAILPPP
jgi:septal ring factor EnvC (AmiA/AmiB activator)